MDVSVINLFPAIRGAYREHRRNRNRHRHRQQPQVGFQAPPPAYTPHAQGDLHHAFAVPMRIKFVQVHHTNRNKMARTLDDQIIVSETISYRDVLSALREKLAGLGVKDLGVYFGARTRGNSMGMGGRNVAVNERNWVDVVRALRNGHFESFNLICN